MTISLLQGKALTAVSKARAASSGSSKRMSEILIIYAPPCYVFVLFRPKNFPLIPSNMLYPHLFLMRAIAFCVAGTLGALGRRFESCRPDS